MKQTLLTRGGPILAALVLALAWISFSAAPAHALLAAGTSITNQAIVTYDENPDPVPSNTVTTTVNLVSALAWIDTTLTPVTSTVGSGGAVSYTVDLRNLGNGTTVVTISDGTTQTTPANLSAGTWSINPSNPTLFATVSGGAGVYDVGAGTTAIPVGWLDTSALTAGVTRVLINGTEYLVAAGSTSTALVVADDASDDADGAGIQIGEVRNIAFTGDAGSLLGGSLSSTHAHSMTASDDVGGGLNASGNPAASDTVSSDQDGGAGNPWLTYVVAGSLSVDKYVRNVTKPAHNPTAAADQSYDGNDYWASGVTGDSDPDGAGPLSGDVLEYLVVIRNAGPGAATDVRMTDALSAFVVLDTTSVQIDTNGNGSFDYTTGTAGNLASYVAPNLTVYAGSGGDKTLSQGGTIIAPVAPATEVVSAIRYQVTIQ